MAKKITADAARTKLWQLGELSWKLKGKQRDIYEHFKNDDKDISCCLVSRQFGKSFTMLVLSIEQCVKNPDTIVKYICPKQKMVERVIKPRIRDIIKDCPDDLKPEWRAQEKVWVFPNGSEIQVAGSDNGNYDNIRGGSAHLCIVDEAGFCSELETVVYSVLAPTTDTTDGKIWLASTPNDKDPNHDFHEFFVIPLEAEGKLIKFTIYDSPLLDDEKRQKIIARYPGGEKNQKFRCEYLVEIPRSSELTVIPEFTEIKEESTIQDYTLPPYYDSYVSVDFGFRDLTVGLFAYYDFKKAQLYIVDELVMNGPEMTTERLAKEIKHKEELRFFCEASNMAITPYMRVADNSLQIINDLTRLHDLNFLATAKDNKEAQINELRMWVTQGKIKIHERCRHLIYHLENALWDKSRKSFRHLKDSPSGEVRGGHADALDALIYLVRNVNANKNPYPNDFGELRGSNVHNMNSRKPSRIQEVMNTIMNINKK